jgi:hypothetical protein
MDLPAPRFGRGWPELERAQVLALAGVIARELASEPDATVNSLAATVEAARETLSHFPQLDLIEACYKAGPEDPCEFCASGGSTLFPPHEPQDPPEWVTQARAERDAAVMTLSAISETVALSDGQGQSLGQWLAGLYRSDKEKFFETFRVLRSDSSPASQQAISEAHSLIFGDQPPAPAGPTPLPGGNMSHTLAAGPSQRRHTLGHQRKHLVEVEGNRFRHFGSGHAAGTISAGDHPQLPPPAPEQPEPPPAEPETEKPRRRRRRRLR